MQTVLTEFNCTNTSAAELRLIGGSRCEGRLEIKQDRPDSPFGQACDFNAGNNEAMVACRQLHGLQSKWGRKSGSSPVSARHNFILCALSEMYNRAQRSDWRLTLALSSWSLAIRLYFTGMDSQVE